MQVTWVLKKWKEAELQMSGKPKEPEALRMTEFLKGKGLYEICQQKWPNPWGKAPRAEGSVNPQAAAAHKRGRFAALADVGAPAPSSANRVRGGPNTHGGRPP